MLAIWLLQKSPESSPTTTSNNEVGIGKGYYRHLLGLREDVTIKGPLWVGVRSQERDCTRLRSDKLIHTHTPHHLHSLDGGASINHLIHYDRNHRRPGPRHAYTWGPSSWIADLQRSGDAGGV